MQRLKLHLAYYAAGLVAFMTAAMPQSALAFGDSQVLLGVRTADFTAAPAAMNLALNEIAASVHSDPFWDLPEVTAGFTFAYDSMRGSLGEGLSDFRGYSFGPELTARYAFGKITPFATVGYRIGRFTGHGTESWIGAHERALFLDSDGQQSLETKAKTYSTAGLHSSLGANWTVAPKVAATLALDLGFDRMESDARVYAGGEEFYRQHNSFNSRSVLLGSQFSF